MLTLTDTLNQALAHHQAGRLQEARSLYAEVLEADSQQPDALHYLGVLAHQVGQQALAVDFMRQSLALNPHNAGWYCNLAEAYKALGDQPSAAKAYQHAIEVAPDLTRAHNSLGAIYLGLGRTLEAAECFRRALLGQPDHAAAHTNRGHALMKLQRMDEALAHYREAVRLEPQRAEFYGNLGAALVGLRKNQEALPILHEAHRLKPRDSQLAANYSDVLRLTGQLEESEILAKRAIDCGPDQAIGYYTLGNCLFAQGRVDEALESYSDSLKWKNPPVAAASNRLFALNYSVAQTPDQIAQEHRAWGVSIERKPVLPLQEARNPEKCLRLGYVSPDLRGHAVTLFLSPILAEHDRRCFEIHCFMEGSQDRVTAQLQALGHTWHNTEGLSDEEMARKIRYLGIDILVDLAGHTGKHRLGAFLPRPAPVQVTYLGYPNTTGLSAIDARLTEAVADPPGADKYYTERLVRLSEGFCCFALPNDAPDVRPLPALQSGYVTFGSPHNLAKLNDRVLSTWADILQRLPTARLRLFRAGLTGTVRDRLLQRFVDRGIAPDRLEIENTSSESVGYAGYLNALGGVDIMLDAFPANAGTTACEALAMGVPIVSLLGDRFYGRLSASLLTRVGLTDWVAESQEQYVEFAVNYAADVPGLAKLRGELRERVKTRLGDGLRFTRALELAYRDLWRFACEYKESI